jgi:RES domain-containing protein
LSVILWRIAQETREYRADDLSGAGAAKVGGRWNSIGKAMVYTSRSVALAYLESLAHLGREAPRNRFLIRISVPDRIWERALWATEKDLPRAWRAEPAGQTSTQFGDKWLAAGKSALLCLPSVIVPEDTNVLINPAHADANHITVKVHRQILYDPRLLRV